MEDKRPYHPVPPPELLNNPVKYEESQENEPEFTPVKTPEEESEFLEFLDDLDMMDDPMDDED